AAGARTVASERPLDSLLTHAIIISHMREHQQIADRNGTRGWFRAVVVFLEPQQHRGVAARRAEPAAFLLVPEPRVLLLLQLVHPREPEWIAVALEQLQESPDEARVIFGVRLDTGLSVAIAAKQGAGAWLPESFEDEAGGSASSVQPRAGVR